MLTTAWILTTVLAVIGLLTAPFEHRLYRSDPGTRRKLLGYGCTIALLWTLAGGAIVIQGWALLLHSPAGTWLPAPAITKPVLGVVIAAYAVVALLPLLQSLRGLRWRRAYAAAIRRGFTALPGLLPNTAAERMGWALVSLSAGICEEVLFRGFLIRFLQDGALLPVAGALVVSSVLFGLGHAYQGPKGILTTMLGGLTIGLLFLLSGSLIPGILLHILLDMQMVYVLRPTAEEKATTTADAA